MGRAKQHAIELDELHIASVVDKNICSKHFEDRSIVNFIRKNYADGYCDYCCKPLKVIHLEDLLEYMMTCISRFYEDAANFMSYNSREGGYLGEILTADELIQERIELRTEPFEVTEDIVNSIDEMAWAEPDRHYDTLDDELMYRWEGFKKIVKHQSRYLFFLKRFKSDDLFTPHETAYKILDDVGRYINQLGLIRKIEAGTIVYRCRQHSHKEKVNEISHLVSPPTEYAIFPNRFSPSGISMFYSSFDEEVSVKETLEIGDKSKTKVTIGEFKLRNTITVIDFNKLPKIPSIFSEKRAKNIYLLRFIYSLVRDFTKPVVKDGREHTDYVPTQIVTEFLRFAFNQKSKNQISGIVYPSSKKYDKPCIVFFWDHSESLNNLDMLNSVTSKVSKYT